MQKLRQKTHKGRLSSVINTVQTIWKGKYAGVALERARVTESQIKAAELAIKRIIRKNGQLWIRINPNIPVSSKPAEVRMGKGKGNFSHFIARVKTGSIIFELDTFQNSQSNSARNYPQGVVSSENHSTEENFTQETQISAVKKDSDILARQAFKVAASKLPLKLRFIKLEN